MVLLTVLSLAPLACHGTLADTRPAPAPATASDAASARCQVWARELSFAQSVADHDAVRFAEHLHPNAAFGVGSSPTLGREAITRQWQGIIDGSAVVLEWYPDRVAVGGDGSIAHSTGPALYRDPKTGQHRLSRFNSVWQWSGDGTWRVVFDDGTRPEPAAPDAVEAFHAGRRQACPAPGAALEPAA